MHRLPVRIPVGFSGPSLARRLASPVALQAQRSRIPVAYASTSSSPEEAESASAQSGGSRSKGAADNKNPIEGAVPDGLTGKGVQGRTGGGKPLESSHHPPPQPKISNASVPGSQPQLTKEQQKEVDAHNEEFERKHGKATPAADDKVDQKFWQERRG